MPPNAEPVRLVRYDLNGLPHHDLPADLTLRSFAEGDDPRWLALQEAAEPGPAFDPTALGEFARMGAARPGRCLFLVADGVDVGTVTASRARREVDAVPEAGPASARAFRDAVRRQEAAGWWGMPAWLAVHPDHRGRRLALPLISAALRILAVEHDRALVRTTADRPAAIRRWMQFGFRPDLDEPGAARTWEAIWAAHPQLGERTRRAASP